MNKVNFIIGGLCLIVNILFGLVLSSYSAFNCGVTSAVILLNVGMMYLLSSLSLKDGFRISLGFIFPIFAIAEFVAGLFSPEQFEDNGFIIFLALALLVQGVLLTVCTISSKH